ncbi:hypothetical protein BB560_004130 [Smittium megazygosporum]|uniref:ARID domain-containing protein n=1 Tax=Smittium megazygosporum TaxID=133381 RepID=A0A2T9ZA12_9FUNG|nr:hypothetical protein BB560_004666 [Smittium megazygosporum]PVV01449.1 hypothetical protein BB560_004130 [Smittium megazygosporum]
MLNDQNQPKPDDADGKLTEYNSFLKKLCYFLVKRGKEIGELSSTCKVINILTLFKFVLSKGGYKTLEQQNSWDSILTLYSLAPPQYALVQKLRKLYYDYLSDFEDAYNSRINNNLSNHQPQQTDLQATPVNSSQIQNRHQINAAQLSGEFLNVYDFFGGPSSRIALSLSSGLPNEIEWGVSRLLKFSFFCNEEYNLKMFSPLLLEQILNLLQLCRFKLLPKLQKNTSAKNLKNKKNEQIKTSDIEIGIEFSDDEYLDSGDDYPLLDKVDFECPILGSKDAFFGNNRGFNQLACDTVLILRNLAIGSTKNCAYFANDPIFLEEISFWFEDAYSFSSLGTELKCLIVELLDIVVGHTSPSNFECFLKMWNVILTEFLESHDQYLVLLSARFISSFWIKIEFSFIAEPHFSEKIFCDNEKTSSIVTKCINILFSGSCIDIELQDLVCYLLLTTVSRESRLLSTFNEKNNVVDPLTWKSCLGFQFDRKVVCIIKLHYNLIRLNANDAYLKGVELLPGNHDKVRRTNTPEFQKMISGYYKVINYMYKIILNLFTWTQEFSKYRITFRVSNEANNNVLSPDFFYEHLFLVNREPNRNESSMEMSNSMLERTQKGYDSGKSSFTSQTPNNYFLNQNLRSELSEIAINIPTDSSRDFLFMLNV